MRARVRSGAANEELALLEALGRDLHEWSTVEIDGYSMVLVEREGEAAAAVRPVSPETQQRDAAIGVTAAALAGGVAWKCWVYARTPQPLKIPIPPEAQQGG